MDQSDRRVGAGTGRDQLDTARRRGERILRLDEIEETLELGRAGRLDLGEHLPTLEERARSERERLGKLHEQEPLRYDEIERAMRHIDLSG